MSRQSKTESRRSKIVRDVDEVKIVEIHEDDPSRLPGASGLGDESAAGPTNTTSACGAASVDDEGHPDRSDDEEPYEIEQEGGSDEEETAIEAEMSGEEENECWIEASAPDSNSPVITCWAIEGGSESLQEMLEHQKSETAYRAVEDADVFWAGTARFQ